MEEMGGKLDQQLLQAFRPVAFWALLRLRRELTLPLRGAACDEAIRTSAGAR